MGRKEAWRRILTAGLVLGMAATAAPSMAFAKGSVCAKSQELAALEARVLQTELMVGALTCGQSQRYNAFVNSYKGDLVMYGKTIRSLFQRAYGGGAKRKLNKFVTKLANDSSQRSNSARQGYCVLAGELFDEASVTPKRTMVELVDKPWIRSKHGFRPCN